MNTGVRRVVVGYMARAFRPTVRLFAWWLPFSLGRFGEVVFMPDAMAIFLVTCASVFLMPLSIALYFMLFVPALLLSPFILTVVVWVRDGNVRVIRFFLVIPYWVHHVSVDAEFDLFQAWEDREPTGVVFGGLHLGTGTSAVALCHHLSALLERGGWKRGRLGVLRAPNADNAL